MVSELFEPKELAAKLGVHPRKVGQSMQPVLDKLERLTQTPEDVGRLLIMLGRQILVSAALERQREMGRTARAALP